ncbi:dipicolinic acid synthetase subunit A [Virgibacillus halodenitrificans]|uniref:Dipicolinic acid synthetase subunit A n=1 Tax=Virgibacillus halodenitrificans TaxID=1482 RepID=A0AAC9J3I7_VIRHA|nr:dipicolinate synthase subunit DpsA [Virgibacillus halodenitrificans]APC48869.1 dipicolinic acid synthetase subunit A [Virgibacillus halodenitrificans]
MSLQKKLLILGGDARYLEAIRLLANKGVDITLMGYDQLQFQQKNVKIVNPEYFSYGHLDGVLLPVGGTDLEGKVETTYSDKTIHLTKELLIQTPEHCSVYTGAANKYLENLTNQTNRKLTKIFQNEETAIRNSIPTAEGALHVAIEETDTTIHNSNVMILGFGRVGKTLARLFSAVGATVHVTVRNKTAAVKAYEMGLQHVWISDLQKKIKDIDICLNTVPAPVLNKQVIANLKKDCVIIDLASAPGGTDFAFAKKQNIKAIHALGLPGKTAPKTAGKIIGEAMYELLDDKINS